jgi:hypothetical protein
MQTSQTDGACLFGDVAGITHSANYLSLSDHCERATFIETVLVGKVSLLLVTALAF